MIQLAEKWPQPPGMDIYAPRTPHSREMTAFLTALSERVAARGGLFSVLFHTRLAVWQYEGTSDALLDSLLANINDSRVEDVLSWRVPSLWPGVKASKYDSIAAQHRLLDGAETATSDQAAAILVAGLHNPMKDFRGEFLNLLRRDKPKLRAQICNILAVEQNKPERMLPFRKDRADWEDRVAAMSDQWLRELGG
jgi:hypothetical protein